MAIFVLMVFTTVFQSLHVILGSQLFLHDSLVIPGVPSKTDAQKMDALEPPSFTSLTSLLLLTLTHFPLPAPTTRANGKLKRKAYSGS